MHECQLVVLCNKMENPCACIYIIVEKDCYGTGNGLMMALQLKKGTVSLDMYMHLSKHLLHFKWILHPTVFAVLMTSILGPHGFAAAGTETQSLSSSVKALERKGRGGKGGLSGASGAFGVVPLPQACAELDSLYLWP